MTAGTQGAEYCADGTNSSSPLYGRIAVYNADGHIGLGADGDDGYNPDGFQAWDRVDVNTSDPRFCFWQGAGTYWTSGGGHSPPIYWDVCTP